jgi:hypothetical protein
MSLGSVGRQDTGQFANIRIGGERYKSEGDLKDEEVHVLAKVLLRLGQGAEIVTGSLYTDAEITIIDRLFPGTSAKVDSTGTKALLPEGKVPVEGKKISLAASEHKFMKLDDVIDHLMGKESSNYQLFSAMHHLFSTDSRFSKGEDKLWQSHAMLRVMAKEKDHELFPPMEVSKAMKQKAAKLAPYFCAFLENEPVKLQTARGAEVTQTLGHVEGTEFVPGATVSSELQKKVSLTTEVANQGSITMGDRVIFARSARTITPEQVLSKSSGDISSRMATSGRAGLKKNGGYYIYRRVDMTAMDRSAFKAQFTENERGFLAKKEGSIAAIWDPPEVVPGDGNTVREVGGFLVKWDASNQACYVERDIGGETVREYRPFKFEFTFSSTASRGFGIGSTALRKTREHNRLAYVRLAGKMPMEEFLNEGMSIRLRAALAACEASPSEASQRVLVGVLQAAYSQASENEGGIEEEKFKAALLGLMINLTGKGFAGEEYNTAEAPALEYLCLKYLTDLTEMALGGECKSGCDRTATAMAAACAAEEFEEITGRVFFSL